MTWQTTNYTTLQQMGDIFKTLFIEHPEWGQMDWPLEGITAAQLLSNQIVVDYVWGERDVYTGSFSYPNGQIIGTINRYESYYQNQLILVETGAVSVDDYINDTYITDFLYGSDENNWLDTYNALNADGKGGTDVIEIDFLNQQTISVWGGEGIDIFELTINDQFSSPKSVVFKDYQPNEKLIFSDFDSLDELLASITNVQDNGNSWSVTFQNQVTLVFENSSLAQLNIQNVLTGDAADQFALENLPKLMGLTQQELISVFDNLMML